MSASEVSGRGQCESPDPSSHATNVYDQPDSTHDSAGEEDDDDMDFEPTTEGSDDGEFFESTEDPEAEFQDAEGDLSGVEIELTLDEDETGEEENPGRNGSIEGRTSQPRSRGPPEPTRIQVPSQILQLLGRAGLRQLLAQRRAVDDDDDDDDDLEYSYAGVGTRRRRRAKGAKCQFPSVPSTEGQSLMNSGVFGTGEHYRDRGRKKNARLARKLMSRELGNDRGQIATSPSVVAQDMIPSSTADTIIHYDSRCYSGQFSDDGNFFFSCAQDFKVRMYDTSNPYSWKYYKTVVYPYGQWTITDATLSPDNKYLAYSSIRSQVCLASTDPSENREPWLLDFSDMGQRRRGGRYHDHEGHFGIWSIRFSGDGSEIVAGTSTHAVYVYDIERRQSILRIPAHSDDVNAVCFGDKSSPHILYSGSDDTLIKVWDRRSMGDSREAGVFMGHTEGLTYVDSKGDGRYVLSNGKDQTMKLWDLRKMMSTEKASTIDPSRFTTAFDYRFMAFSEEDWRPHPHDCSLVTYRGHSVLKTLIRCHFSPPGSTNSRYVYSGSEDGSVHIYNMDATLAGKVNVRQATESSRPLNPHLDVHSYEGHGGRNSWKTCVRDASWHPNAPVIAATSWNGWGMGTGTCTTHSWNDGAEDDEGEPKMGLRVDQRLQRDERLYDNPRAKTAAGGGLGRSRTGLRSQGVQAAQAAAAEQGGDGDEEEDDTATGMAGGWW